VAGDLRLGHGEAHVREESPRAALADVSFGLLVSLGGSRADDVDPQLLGQPRELGARHLEFTVAPRFPGYDGLS
jgi:hypothetical protein